MPFPWKRNKFAPVSKLIADLHSPKRGASLLVQTGFPTSLIHLFLQNRTRFTKPNSKKPVRQQFSDTTPPPPPPPPSPSPAPPPPMPETSNSRGCMVVSAESRLTESRFVRENDHGDDGISGSGREVNQVGECAAGSVSKTVVAAFLIMLVVVVLVLSVKKKLTVGITMSAFALLFLECAGRRAVSCFSLRPRCSNANMVIMKSLARRVSASACIWFQKLHLNIRPLTVQGEMVVFECGSNSLSFEEIEVVETKSKVGVCCEETCFAGHELDCLSADKKWGCSGMGEDSKGKVVELCEISQCKTNKGSRSVKFKSKMVKKLVPKRLRGSKQEKKQKRSKESEAESSTQGSSTAPADKSLPSFEIEEEQDNVGKEEEDNGNRLSVVLKTKLESLDNEVDHDITCSQNLSRARVESVLNNEEKRIDRVRNSGYIILLIIALAGLVIGRFPALILTMTWFFMLKIVKGSFPKC